MTDADWNWNHVLQAGLFGRELQFLDRQGVANARNSSWSTSGIAVSAGDIIDSIVRLKIC